MSPAAKIAIILIVIILIAGIITTCIIFKDEIKELFGGDKGGNTPPTTLPKGEGELLITYIDVGQGDCILIQLPDGKNMLVDAGTKMGTETQERAMDFVENSIKKEDGTTKLDYVMLTHQDDDHLEFMADVVNRFEVGTLYTPMLVDKDKKDWNDTLIADYTAQGYGMSTTTLYKNYLDAVKTRKDAGKLGNIIYSEAGQLINEAGTSYEMKILAPYKDMYAKHKEGCSAYIKNGVSPIFVLTYEGRKVIFTGDATGHNSEPSEGSDGTLGGTEEQFIDFVDKNGLKEYVDCDVLKLGHHGSQSSTTNEFLAYVKPEYAVVSVGAANYNGNPKTYSAEQDICYDKDGTKYHSKYCKDNGLTATCKADDETEGNTFSHPNKNIVERVRKITDLTAATDDNPYLTDDDRIYATDEKGDITISIKPQTEGKGALNFTFGLEEPDFTAMEEQLKADLATAFIYNNPFTVQNLLCA